MQKKSFSYKINADLGKDAGSDSLVGTFILNKKKITGEITLEQEI